MTGFCLMQIMGLLCMCFDPAVAFVFFLQICSVRVHTVAMPKTVSLLIKFTCLDLMLLLIKVENRYVSR